MVEVLELRAPEEAKSSRGHRGTIHAACRGSRATWHLVEWELAWWCHDLSPTHGQILVPSFECFFFLNEGIMLRPSLSWTPRFVPMFAQPERRAWVSGNFAEEFALKLQQEAAGADETAMFLCFVHFRACLHIK